MKLSCRWRSTADNMGRYMTCDEFGNLLAEKMKEFYQLAFLLTADTRLAERCFIATLEDCMSASGVFHEWAHTWTRRAIIKNAVQVLMNDTRHEPNSRADRNIGGQTPNTGESVHPEFETVLSLPAFDRFVFVLSVLDKYADGEVASLLGRSIKEVHEARIRALRQIVSPMLESGVAATDRCSNGALLEALD